MPRWGSACSRRFGARGGLCIAIPISGSCCWRPPCSALPRPAGTCAPQWRSSWPGSTEEPQVTLLEAMRAAQERDSIARQYARDYSDVFDLGLSQWRYALERFENEAWATTHLYLVYLSTWRDSLIERKFGTTTAQTVSERAREFHSQLSSYSDLSDISARLLSWDEQLRNSGLNPGTSADLTVATVFAAKLTRAV